MSKQNTLIGGGVGNTVSGPAGGIAGAVAGAFSGGNRPHTSGQTSYYQANGNTNFDPATATPDQLATQLGHFGIGYDANKQGSYENTANGYLQKLTPDHLIKRYSDPNFVSVSNNDSLQKQAYDTAKGLLGRDLSGSELAQILPAFQGPNGMTNGQAFVANLAQQYKMNPQLDPMSSVNQMKPGDIQGSLQQQFQSVLGRAPSSDELSHFTQAIQSGQTDAYGVGNFLKQMPEYTNAQDAQFRSGLNTELQGYDTTEFNREKQGVMADYASRGMAPGTSPSLDYALTDLMGRIAQNRSQYLAGVSTQQYGGNKDLAVGNYQNSLNQMYGQQQNNLQNNRAYGSQLLNQGFQGADYQNQMNNLMTYMNGQNQGRNTLHTGDWLNLGLNAVGTGAKAFSYLNG